MPPSPKKDFQFDYEPSTGLVFLTIAKKNSAAHKRIKYHPWLTDKWGRKCAKLDIAVQMLRLYQRLQLSFGVNTPLLNYFDALKKAQQNRLELLDKSITLWPYQVDGVKRLVSQRRILLADEMGLGKTLQAITAMRPNDGVTVICPSVVKGHWAAEFAKARGGNVWADIRQGRQADFCWAKPGHVQIFNKEILPESPEEDKDFLPDFQSPYHPSPIHRQSVIVDEAHVARNKKTMAHKRISAITGPAYLAGGNVLALTATPVLNQPFDLWNVLNAIQLGNDLFGSWKRFKFAFQAKYTDYGTKWGKALPHVEELLSFGMIRRKKADVLKELPPKRHRIYPVRTGLEPIEFGKPVSEMETGEMQTLGTIATRRVDLATAKIEALMELVDEHESVKEALVVFSAHRAPIEHLARREGWVAITGTTPPDVRTMYVDRFQSGLYKGIALTIAAGGVGITLTRASNIIFVDRSWTPAENEQAEDRCHRIGQTESILITDIVSDDAVDRRVFEVATGKLDLLCSAGLGFSTQKQQAAMPLFESLIVSPAEVDAEFYPECTCPGDFKHCPLHNPQALEHEPWDES